MRGLVRSSLLVWLCVVPLMADELREAPNAGAVPANQLSVAGNACGPAALLNAFRFGSESWRRPLDGVSGKNDPERILTIIREVGMRPSKHVPGRARWSKRGVNLADLRDMGNEMAAGKQLPQLREDVFFAKNREKPEKLLRRVHDRLETSMERGFPAVLSLRRYVHRKQDDGALHWVAIDAHFVTLAAVAKRLGRKSTSFQVSYIDPWGGKLREGRVEIPSPALFLDGAGNPACLDAAFPHAAVGKESVRPGEKSVLVLAAAIGRW